MREKWCGSGLASRCVIKELSGEQGRQCSTPLVRWKRRAGGRRWLGVSVLCVGVGAGAGAGERARVVAVGRGSPSVASEHSEPSAFVFLLFELPAAACSCFGADNGARAPPRVPTATGAGRRRAWPKSSASGGGPGDRDGELCAASSGPRSGNAASAKPQFNCGSDSGVGAGGGGAVIKLAPPHPSSITSAPPPPPPQPLSLSSPGTILRTCTCSFFFGCYHHHRHHQHHQGDATEDG